MGNPSLRLSEVLVCLSFLTYPEVYLPIQDFFMALELGCFYPLSKKLVKMMNSVTFSLWLKNIKKLLSGYLRYPDKKFF